MFFSPLTLSNFRALFQDNYAQSLLNSVIITALATGLHPDLRDCLRATRSRAGSSAAGASSALSCSSAGWCPPVIYIIPLFLFFHLLNLIGSFTRADAGVPDRPAAVHGLDVGLLFPGRAGRTRGGRAGRRGRQCRAFFKIALPLALPGVVSVGLLIGIAAWGEYFIPLILGGFATDPATVGIVDFIGVDGSSWGPMAAGALCLIVPVFVATLAAQRGLVRGLTAGAIKG